MKKTTEGQNSENGFTIIEVMIAMFIFSVGILAMALLQISFIQGNSTANNITEASYLAADKLEELFSINFEESGNELDTGNSPFSETSDQYSISWTVFYPDLNNNSTVDPVEQEFKQIQMTVVNTATSKQVVINTMRVAD